MDIIKDSFPYGSLLLDVYDGVNRIKESVVFWTGSDKRVQKFEGVANQLASGYKRKLTLDCKIRWNSTYEMLCVAINYEEVFAVLSGRDKLYKNPPTPEDWEKLGKICELLEVFAKLTLDFSASKTPTANICFSKICKLKITLSTWLSSPYDYVVKMAKVMLEKYKKYWDSMNGLMGVATILDPRYKMALIRFYFAKLFDKYEYDREVSRISNLLRRLVDEYESRSENTQSKRQLPSNLASGGSSCDDVDMEEFAQFLERDKIKLMKNRIWTTFSTSGRVLDPYRSRLLPQAVEALMCSQNWIWAALKNFGEFKDKNFAKIVGELEEECEMKFDSDEIILD
ncbi:zinc finger BED domain-containing protein RICESLEEPER 3-like [Amaranthus tricolor]|uniref:zinc finger BED domain-containing protein RICESLEEPER 3-like n=1 Tax=Amaranthus tricolor TaxID=29722 RepID=UPI00258ED87B|nr:zinc finger BED domain-containing protein RICESLEEPER 3-like [Amaranthus tricolor]